MFVQFTFLKLTWALPTLSEHMHMKFEVNQTKIKGGFQWDIKHLCTSLQISADLFRSLQISADHMRCLQRNAMIYFSFFLFFNSKFQRWLPFFIRIIFCIWRSIVWRSDENRDQMSGYQTRMEIK